MRQEAVPSKWRGFSVDTWALLLAALVRGGVFKQVPW